MNPIRVTVVRGGVTEAVHRVHAVAVRDGDIVALAGDARLVTFLRSSGKPFQALPLVRARPDLDEAEIAIACASHQAEPAQLRAVRSLLRVAEASEDDLECGFQEGRERRRICHSCSGKHAGMLTLCKANGWPIAGYSLLGHPLQQTMLAEFAAAAKVPEGEIPTAVEGCGVVTFGFSLERIAFAFSGLERLEGGSRLVAAMRARPELVGGVGADDTDIMRALPDWVAKRGAEGILCAAGPDGIGISVKSEDGSQRSLRPALAAFFESLGSPIEQFARIPLTNSRGENVGEVCI